MTKTILPYQSYKERKRAAVKQGLCYDCETTRDATGTNWRCRLCADKFNERRRAYCATYMERGVCFKCKKRHKGKSLRCFTCSHKLWSKIHLNRSRLEVYQRDSENRRLKRTFGITLAEYEAMSESQNNCCAICKQPPSGRRLSVDHSHATTQIRGLLCVSCNSGLGAFRDDIQLLRTAMAYLDLYL